MSEGIYKIMDLLEEKGYKRIAPKIYFTNDAIYATIKAHKEGRHNATYGYKVLKDTNIIEYLLDKLSHDLW